MKILIIVPRYLLTKKKNYEYYFPLGLGYISSTLKNAGYSVDCLNLNHNEGIIDDIILNALDKVKYDFVCTGHIGIGYQIIDKILKTTRNHRSNPKIILGGAIITSEPQLIFESLKPDIGVIGEGEKTIIELLSNIERMGNLKNVKGIIFKDKNGKIIVTDPQEQIMDLDSIPIPDFDGLGYKEQLENLSSASDSLALFDYPRIYTILGSRGCAFKCTFCYHCLGNKFRTRSINNLMEEIEIAVKKYNINIIGLNDDLFSLDRNRLFDFCTQIKKLINSTGKEIKWGCQLSVRDIDKELMLNLKESGCAAVSFGFESFSQKVLKSMKKPITPQQIENAINLTLETGLSLQGNFIFGDIAETVETAKETLDFFKNKCNGQVNLGFIQPYPGSEIYNHCINNGIIKDKLDFIKNKMNITNWFNMTKEMTDSDIYKLKKEISNTRNKYIKYVVPEKITKDNIDDRYNLLVKCPFCEKKTTYKNMHIHDRLVYSFWVACRHCTLRFHIVSTVYKLGLKHYQKIDFLRKCYLLIKNTLLIKKI
jgi:anaerobic magnesium-protoporphyrin IX monomethyl ester cyclase